MRARKGRLSYKTDISTKNWLLKYTLKRTCKKWKRTDQSKYKIVHYF